MKLYRVTTVVAVLLLTCGGFQQSLVAVIAEDDNKEPIQIPMAEEEKNTNKDKF
jgi:hypothetical protein